MKIEVKKKIDVIFDFRPGQERRKLVSAVQRDHDFKTTLGGDEKKPRSMRVRACLKKIFFSG
ncbi:MAG: hypothetical protein LAO76_06870 [Acidobacteriia bacterium]|nr:hypothetical protein [Terriglobia bacterium]